MSAEDIRLAIELASFAGGVGGIIFALGKYAARLESLTHEILAIRPKLEAIPKLVADVEQLKDHLGSHVRSFHSELGRKIDDTRDLAIRAEARSSGDIGE